MVMKNSDEFDFKPLNVKIEAPESIVRCINDFVDSIHRNWDKLSDSLAASLGQDKEFVSELLNQLTELFVIKP